MRVLYDIIHDGPNALKELIRQAKLLFPETEEAVTGKGALLYKLQTWALMNTMFTGYEWTQEEIVDLAEIE